MSTALTPASTRELVHGDAVSVTTVPEANRPLHVPLVVPGVLVQLIVDVAS